MRSYWVGPKTNESILIKEKDRETQGRRPCEGRGRDWSYDGTSQGT